MFGERRRGIEVCHGLQLMLLLLLHAAGCCVLLLLLLRLQVVSGPTRAPNAIEVLKANGIHHLDPDLADTVMSLRLYQ